MTTLDPDPLWLSFHYHDAPHWRLIDPHIDIFVTILNSSFKLVGRKDLSCTTTSKDNPTDEMSRCEAMEPTSMPLKLLEKITNNFSEERVLGHGAYGKVYRGVHDDRGDIAVKLLHNSMQTIDDKQFIHEFDNLMMLKHPNIVRFVGYCYETQRQHIQFEGRVVFGETTYKALCFEYMPKGSLQKHLSDECNGLDWQTRYNIIKGACEGLKYLHEGFEKPFYHLDLKPDNILLDENMTPKLADFGLSKLVGEEQTRITQSPIAGTLGYMAPEYLSESKVSKKLDIFSLGVVMTKIIAGPNGQTIYAEIPYKQFLDQVQGNWRKRLQTPWSSPESLEALCQQVKRCTEIALTCMEIDRHKRPSIVDIIHDLDQTEKNIENINSYEQDPSPPLDSSSNVVEPVASAPPTTPSPPPFLTQSYIGSSTPCPRPPPKNSPVMTPPPPPPPVPRGGIMELFGTFMHRKAKISGHGQRFTYNELASATHDFSKTQKLEEGAFWTVYKGTLTLQDKQGKKQEVSVAIKKNKHGMSDEAREAFKNEIDIMSPLNHHNIIRLVGWCDKRNNLLLVYELLEDRNLEAHLYGHGAHMDAEHSSARSPGSGFVLDWRKRDIKPENVMLDSGFNAKLCGFGLVMQLNHAMTSRSMDNIIKSQVYMDPAYRQNVGGNRESDVYSFGVLLLEVICGVKPKLTSIDKGTKNSLVEMVRECQERDAILDAADQRLRGEFDEEIKGVLFIGLRCVETRHGDRPTIEIVLDRLVSLTAK
ncbi:hypothetical protein CFC21_032970 [Triticum aestivum]|uniref:Protein kinase domain-containing protein n=2 Tax=Triticum aestivum TaxID=4565 RepID=A0A3B6DNT7_WHEAT|nr:hypothetical protein CFC21_032970 [Triticum aestivum]